MGRGVLLLFMISRPIIIGTKIVQSRLHLDVSIIPHTQLAK